MTTIDTTEIRYDRITKDYAIYDDGRIIAYGRNYSEAEAKRTAYLAERDGESNACSGFGCVDGCGDCQAKPAFEVREQSKFATTPEDRGILIGYAVTWSEAVAKRDQAVAAGWPAYISRVHA